MADALTREFFLSTVKAAGLDAEGPHMEELYAYLQKVLPGFGMIDRLDLTDVEPLVTMTLHKEHKP